jgi:hypothetical protein
MIGEAIAVLLPVASMQVSLLEVENNLRREKCRATICDFDLLMALPINRSLPSLSEMTSPSQRFPKTFTTSLKNTQS